MLAPLGRYLAVSSARVVGTLAPHFSSLALHLQWWVIVHYGRSGAVTAEQGHNTVPSFALSSQKNISPLHWPVFYVGSGITGALQRFFFFEVLFRLYMCSLCHAEIDAKKIIQICAQVKELFHFLNFIVLAN